MTIKWRVLGSYIKCAHEWRMFGDLEGHAAKPEHYKTYVWKDSRCFSSKASCCWYAKLFSNFFSLHKQFFYLERRRTKLQRVSKIMRFEASNLKKCIPHSFFIVLSSELRLLVADRPSQIHSYLHWRAQEKIQYCNWDVSTFQNSIELRHWKLIIFECDVLRGKIKLILIVVTSRILNFSVFHVVLLSWAIIMSNLLYTRCRPHGVQNRYIEVWLSRAGEMRYHPLQWEQNVGIILLNYVILGFVQSFHIKMLQHNSSDTFI